MVDILLASTGLVVLSPILLVVALLVKASGPGPVFHRAWRTGLFGRTFLMWKFRTMHVGAAAGPMITAPGDSRVTRIGRFLRSSKIDELPQLLNILRGDMSLVGPRPEDPEIVREHYRAAEWETLEFRPGLTSPGTLWYYERAEDELDAIDPMRTYLQIMRAKLAVDRAYLRRANAVTDLGVMLATVAVIGKVLLRRRVGRTGYSEP